MKLCELYEDMISAFIDGALEEKEHMAVCPDCQTYFNEQIALHDALMGDAAEIQPPENFTADVMAHVRFSPQEKRRKPAVRWPQWAALAACCAIAAVGLWRGRLRGRAQCRTGGEGQGAPPRGTSGGYRRQYAGNGSRSPAYAQQRTASGYSGERHGEPGNPAGRRCGSCGCG